MREGLMLRRWWVAAGAAVGVAALVWLVFVANWHPSSTPSGNVGPAVVETGRRDVTNETDEFVNFCLEQHGSYASQWAPVGAGSVEPGRLRARGRPMAPRPPLRPAMTGEGKQWWWVSETR